MKKEKSYPKVHSNTEKLFTIVETAEKEVIICIGNTKVLDTAFESVEEAEKCIKKKPWELMVNVMCKVFEVLNESEKYENKD